ncbi:hypothetical protein RLOatenuis_8310 [Rickettsiales bacterium]|nr:hypothetical protein RLOatenuis_8310 [Rickettsiales bacterium]
MIRYIIYLIFEPNVPTLQEKIEQSYFLFLDALKNVPEDELSEDDWEEIKRTQAINQQKIIPKAINNIAVDKLKQSPLEAAEDSIVTQLRSLHPNGYPERKIVDKVTAIKRKLEKSLTGTAAQNLASTHIQDCAASTADYEIFKAVYGTFQDLTIKLEVFCICPYKKKGTEDTYEYPRSHVTNVKEHEFRWGFNIDSKSPENSTCEQHKSTIDYPEKLLERNFKTRTKKKEYLDLVRFEVEYQNFEYVKVQELTASQKIYLAIILKKNIESLERVKDNPRELKTTDGTGIECRGAKNTRSMEDAKARVRPKQQDIENHISEIKSFINDNLSAEIEKIEKYWNEQEERIYCGTKKSGFCTAGSKCRSG